MMKENIQCTVKELWKSILNVQKTSDNDNFFEQGGTSVMAIQLIFQISESTNRTIAEFEFIKNPTLGNLTSLVENSQTE